MSASNLFSKLRVSFQDRRKLVASSLLVLVLLMGMLWMDLLQAFRVIHNKLQFYMTAESNGCFQHKTNHPPIP
jgi:hypothetical protein